MLVDVGNGFPEVLEMMECGYFRLFELVVCLFIVVLSVIFGHYRLFELVVCLFIVVLSAIFGYFRLFSVIIWPFLAKSTSFLLIFLL